MRRLFGSANALSALRGAGAGISKPPAVCAAYGALLVVSSLIAAYGDERVQGVEVRSLRSLVESGYRDEVWAAAGLSVGLATFGGAMAGLGAWAAVRVRERAFGLEACGRWGLAARALVLAASGHALLVASDVAARPALYEQWLYARGGFRRALQLGLTDGLGPRGVLLLGALSGFAWMLWPLPARFRHAARAIAALRAPRTALLMASLMAMLIVATIAAGPRGFVTVDPTRHPNVLLLAVDSLRADRIEPRVAPVMSELADKSVRFERAYVSLPRTFPSWMTLLTGRHPHHHGIRSMFPTRQSRSKEFHAIPGELRKAGYATAVIGDFAADIFRRVDLGFERVDTPTFNFRELIRVRVLSSLPALLPLSGTSFGRRLVPSFEELHHAADPSLVTRKALAAIDRTRGRPFFTTVFYSGAHFPYAASFPFHGKFADPAYRGPFKYAKANLLGREKAPDAADLAQIRALYDGAVAATDAAIGELVDGLEKRGLAGSTVIVLTADHGESLYEYGRAQGHGDHLFGDEVTHVPLLIVDPRRPGARRVSAIVRDVDLAPTISELAGVSMPAAIDGHSLVPALDGKPLPALLAYGETGLWFTEDVPDVPAALRLPYPDLTGLLEIRPEHGDDLAIRPELELFTILAKHRMVRDSRHKLVYAPTRSGAKLFLFDTESDPGETKNLIAERPDLARPLEAELWRWMLEDRKLERRGELLVPRATAFEHHASAAPGMRIQEAPGE